MLQRFAVHFHRTFQYRVAVMARAANAVQERVHLGYQRIEERARVRLNQGEHGAKRRRRRPAIFASECRNGLFPPTATQRDKSCLRFYSGRESQDALRIATGHAGLLLFEQVQQAAIVRELSAKTLSNNFPILTHRSDAFFRNNLNRQNTTHSGHVR